MNACKTCGDKTAFTECAQCATGENILDTPNDPINSPAHYKFGQYEVIDIIEAWLKERLGTDSIPGFLWASMQQYLFRFNKKKGVQDLKKAEWYLRRLITVTERGDE